MVRGFSAMPQGTQLLSNCPCLPLLPAPVPLSRTEFDSLIAAEKENAGEHEEEGDGDEHADEGSS